MISQLASTAYGLIRRQISTQLVYRVFDRSLHGLAALLRLYPGFWPGRHGIEVMKDVPYSDSPSREHTLDIFRPIDAKKPLPVILYVHGGSFSSLSKDTHFLLALRFASQGYLVFNINYRLAPRHPFPAALYDCRDAYSFVVRSAAEHGGDISRLALAGESAGANLITALTLCTSYKDTALPELFALGVQPAAVLPACGLLQTSDVQRLITQHPESGWVVGLRDMIDGYLAASRGLDDALRALADPLLFLERGEKPTRPLPPFFVTAGTADPLLDDSRRLQKAIEELDVPCEARYYDDEIHAFHAFLWRPNAQRCWQDSFSFLKAHLAPL